MNSNASTIIEFTQESANVLVNKKALSGDLAMWFFILAELTVFAILFLAFAVTEQLKPDMFSAGKQTLHVWVGVINTIALITSSYFVAQGIRIYHQNSTGITVYFSLAIASAIIYLVAKGWEYQALFDAGYDMSTNTFYTLYFFTTAFHFMHVILGMIILAYVALKLHNPLVNSMSLSSIESGALYWHMVDLVWIVLFPLVYVL